MRFSSRSVAFLFLLNRQHFKGIFCSIKYSLAFLEISTTKRLVTCTYFLSKFIRLAGLVVFKKEAESKLPRLVHY